MVQKKQSQLKQQQFSEQMLMFVLEFVSSLEKYLLLRPVINAINSRGPDARRMTQIARSAIEITISLRHF